MNNYDGKIDWQSIFDDLPDPVQELEEAFRREHIRLMREKLERSQEQNPIVH